MKFQLFKLVLEKVKEPEIKLPTFAGSSKEQDFQKNIYFCFIDYAKVFYCVDHNKPQKILQEMGIPDHLTGLLRNLYEGQEAHEVRRGVQVASLVATGKSGLHGRAKGERVIALKSG